MLFIRIGQQEPESNYRSYIFPYRIGQTGTLFEKKETAWETKGTTALVTNLADECDPFAVKQKLMRLGYSIRAQELPILALIVAQSEDDMLDVFIKETSRKDPQIWRHFEKILSNAFCLPVRLLT